MATNPNSPISRTSQAPSTASVGVPEKPADEARLLLDAFETFTNASSSLENAFKQLEERTRRISEELDAKNRQLKQSLREKAVVQNYLSRILQSLPCGVLVLDERGKITMCNPVASQILRLPSGKPGRRRALGRRHQTPELQEYLTASAAARDEGKEVEVPFGSSPRKKALAISVTPLTGSAGRRIGSLHIIRDVTEMKALQERNKRGERLAAMGEMAVELAHEIRNPLGSIELFASLLEQELPRSSDTGRWAENIRIGSRSLNNIVSNMLQFANPLAPEFQPVNLHELVDEVLGFTDPILRQRDVRAERELTAVRTEVTGDRELLKQMLLNLVLNALQAMPAEGRLRLATRDADSLPGDVPFRGIVLQVEDSGLGIPAENLERVFDPFFTTNKNGTGLGLSVVHQIVDQHSGVIAVRSTVNVGTTFAVFLPAVRIHPATTENDCTCLKTY